MNEEESLNYNQMRVNRAAGEADVAASESECCHEWKTGAMSIDGLCSLGSTHGMPYTGSAFKFCPWCGASRQSDKLTRHNN